MKQPNLSIMLDKSVRLVFATEGTQSHFFGYYDKTPFSDDEQLILCHTAHFDGRMPHEEDNVEIGYWNIHNGQYTHLADTYAFNWQQGAMLQWLPGSHNRRVIFNSRGHNRFEAIIFDRETKIRQPLPTTIYSLSPCGRYALTPRYERLSYPRPGYGYMGIHQESWNQNLPKGDGLILMDIPQQTHKLVVETEHLTHIQPVASMQGALHYVEHVLISPDGNRCIFLHRWKTPQNKIITRLYAANLDGSDLSMIPDSGMYSHAIWLSTDTFVVWGSKVGVYSHLRNSQSLFSKALNIVRKFHKIVLLRQLRSKVIQDNFLHFSKEGKFLGSIGKGKIKEDGHPSICPINSSLLLVDTYEDRQGYQHLYIYDMKKDRIRRIGKFYTPSAFRCTGFRCDLHPRWSPSGKYVCVDAIQDNRRQMFVLDVSEVL